MSIWRAPLLIIGIVLILLASAALAAPWLVDWNRYKPRLVAWAEAFTGRAVRIGGGVDFRLFPWPAARLHDISVAGAEGGRFEHLLKVEAVEARFSLAALLSGRLEVESVRLIRPELALEHLGNGRGNWQLSPRARVALPFSPERVSIDSVRVEDGRILLADQRVRGVLRITGASLDIRARALSGPWRMEGTWEMLGRRWRVRAATGKLEGAEPISVSLRMEPPEKRSGQLVRLNGALRRGDGEDVSSRRFEGKFTLEPVLGSGRGDLLDPARLLKVRGELRLTPEVVELRDIRAEPLLVAGSPFETITGRARLEPGRVTNLSVLLRTPKLRLDDRLARVLGVRGVVDGKKNGLALLRRTLRGLAGRVAGLPPELLVEADLAAGVLEARGASFRKASLTAEVTHRLLAVHHLRAELPTGAITFRGDLLGGDLLQLTGDLEMRSDDARRLLFSLSPRLRALLADVWRGVPGKLDLLATVDLTDEAVRLVSRRLALDGAGATLDWRHVGAAGEEARDDVRLSLKRLDVDRLLGAAARRGAAEMILALGRRLMDEHAGALALDVRADELRLAGMAWRGVALEVSRRPGEVAVKTLKVADVGGLRLDGGGLFRAGGQASWLGELSARLKGADAAAVWRLAGALRPGAGEAPAWLARLGAVDLGLRLGLEAANGARDGQKEEAIGVRVALTGKAGPAEMDVRADGTADIADPWKGRWTVKADVKGARARAVLALAGVDVPLVDGAGALSLSMSGVPRGGMTVALRGAAPGLILRYDGEARLEGAATGWRALAGAGEVFARVEDASIWARPLGLYVRPRTVLAGTARLAFGGRALALDKVRARVNEVVEVAGSLRLTLPEAGVTAVEEAAARHARLSGRLSVSRLGLRDVLALLLAAPDDRRRLREDVAAGLALDMDVRADEVSLLVPGWRLPEATLRLAHDGEGRLSLRLEAGRGKPGLRADVLFARGEQGMETSATLNAALPLARVLRVADGGLRVLGDARLELRARGRAATMRGLLAALKGDGKATLRGARLEGLSPESLLKRLRALKREEELKDFERWAVRALHSGQWPLPEEAELALDLRHGLVEVKPYEWRRGKVRTRLSGLMDLFRRQVDMTLEFIEQGEKAAPLFSVALSGPPTALVVSHDVALLREWIQQELIRRRMEELRRLERERARREEAARRLERKLREEEERRKRERAERMRQQAREMRARLEETLRAIYQQEQERLRREREKAHTDEKAQGGAMRGDSALTIEALIREAEREERKGRTREKPATSPAPKPDVPAPATVAVSPAKPGAPARSGGSAKSGGSSKAAARGEAPPDGPLPSGAPIPALTSRPARVAPKAGADGPSARPTPSVGLAPKAGFVPVVKSAPRGRASTTSKISAPVPKKRPPRVKHVRRGPLELRPPAARMPVAGSAKPGVRGGRKRPGDDTGAAEERKKPVASPAVEPKPGRDKSLLAEPPTGGSRVEKPVLEPLTNWNRLAPPVR